MVYKFFIVAGLSVFEIYAAIPAGLAFGLPPLFICIASIIGGLAGVFIATFLGDKIRRLVYKKDRVKKEKPKTGLAYTIWNKFGLIGLGILGTITLGAPISIGVGVGLNVPLYKMLIWCCLGVLVRCVVFTAVGYYGLKLF
jgi:membrane protein YqaA with SNARE-associated domain